MNKDYANKYRPTCLEDVVGQDHIVKSIQEIFKSKEIPHSFLFTGNSGTGKTTLARIIAKEVGCLDQNVIEIDAATYTGIDDMRVLKEGLMYGAIGENSIKVVILDEFHGVSRKGMDSLLKIVEEPPPHVYFCFCTTEPAKIPKTLQTRCHEYYLKDVEIDDLLDLLEYVRGEEHLIIDSSSLMLIAKESYGSPRRALSYLSKCRGCGSKQDVVEVLRTVVNESQVIDLCRLLINRPNLLKSINILKNLKGQNSESVRIQMVAYFTACVFQANSEKDVLKFIDVIDIFSKPVYEATGFADILLSLGEFCLEK